MSNQDLAIAVCKNVPETKIELIVMVIEEHQRQQPGAWQEWKMNEKTKTVTAWFRKAQRANETRVHKIVSYGE